MPSLIIFKDERLFRVIPLETPTITIGRRSTCDLNLDHHSVSRNHARILQAGDAFEVVDEGSTNGILVNGQTVPRAGLQHGDVVQIGQFALHFDASAEPTRLTPAADVDRIQNAYRSLEALFLVSSDFSALVNLAELLEKMLDCLMEIFQAERGQILLVTSPVRDLKPMVSRKLGTTGLSEHASRTVARQVAETKRPALINDIQAESQLQRAESIQAAEIRSIICTPLLKGHDLLGVLYLDSQLRLRKFVDDDLKLLDSFSRHAANLIANTTEKEKLRRDVRNLQAIQQTQLKEAGDLSGIIGSCEAIRRVLRVAEQVARKDVTTLILGQSGTGKELLARAIHNASARRDRPFVAVNCMALSPDVIESELFGHEKGAFTGASDRRLGRFELADTGTLFLDEIGELSREIQVKLLRVLQERQIERVGSSEPIAIDVRLLVATNQNLEELVRQGQFREDLYYRINVIAVSLPPLKDRREDVPLLVDHFISVFNRQMGLAIRGITREALEVLVAYPWPGNIRELRNVIERAFVLELSDEIALDSLPFGAPRTGPPPPPATGATGVAGSGGAVPAGEGDGSGWPAHFEEARAMFERQFLLDALRRHKGNVTAAAAEIDVPRKTLYRKIEVLGLDLDELQEAHEITEKQMILASLKKHGGNITAVSQDLGIPRTSVYRKLTSYGVDLKESH